MQAIDPYYFALSVPLVMALMAAMCLVVWHHYRHRRYLLWMAANQVLLTCALTGQALTSTEHAYISALWVTALYLGSSVSLHRALCLWLGHTQRLLPLSAIATVCLAVMWFLLDSSPSIALRITTVSLGMAAILLFGLARLARRRARNRLDLLIHSLYLMTALSALLRPLLLLLHGEPSQGTVVVAHSLVWWTTLVCMLVLSIGMSIAFVGGAIFQTVQQLRTERDHDSLTGLLNRRAFEEACAPSPYAQGIRTLIACDLDRFKQINDRYGHACGDAVLRHFGQLLRLNTRAEDLCARIGGEEFAIALTAMSLQDAKQLTQRLAHALATRPCLDLAMPEHFKVTSSFGIVQVRQDESLHQALKRVDTLLYAAKDAGRNRIQTETTYA